MSEIVFSNAHKTTSFVGDCSKTLTDSCVCAKFLDCYFALDTLAEGFIIFIRNNHRPTSNAAAFEGPGYSSLAVLPLSSL